MSDTLVFLEGTAAIAFIKEVAALGYTFDRPLPSSGVSAQSLAVRIDALCSSILLTSQIRLNNPIANAITEVQPSALSANHTAHTILRLTSLQYAAHHAISTFPTFPFHSSSLQNVRLIPIAVSTHCGRSSCALESMSHTRRRLVRTFSSFVRLLRILNGSNRLSGFAVLV